MTWYPTANMSAKGTQPFAIISAIHTVEVAPKTSPNTEASLLNNNVVRAKTKNQDDTPIGALSLLPSVM